MTSPYEYTSNTTDEYIGRLYMKASRDIGRRVVAPLLHLDATSFVRHCKGGDFYLQVGPVLHGHERAGIDRVSYGIAKAIQDENWPHREPIRQLAIDVLPRRSFDMEELPPDFRLTFHLNDRVERKIQALLGASDTGSRAEVGEGFLHMTANYNEFREPRRLAEARDEFNGQASRLGAAAFQSLYNVEPHSIRASIVKRPLAKQ